MDLHRTNGNIQTVRDDLVNYIRADEAEKRFKILWVNINFRDRLEGKSTHKFLKSITMIFQLVRKIG